VIERVDEAMAALCAKPSVTMVMHEVTSITSRPASSSACRSEISALQHAAVDMLMAAGKAPGMVLLATRGGGGRTRWATSRSRRKVQIAAPGALPEDRDAAAFYESA
jgi:hypothetical protein